MNATRRTFLTTWGVGGAAAVVLAGCSREPEGAATPTDVTVAIVMKDGALSPNAARVNVVKGATVTVTVDSDQDLHVHVHGYEEEIIAKPGEPAEVSFVADLVGSFEIETHDPAVVVAQLVVR